MVTVSYVTNVFVESVCRMDRDSYGESVIDPEVEMPQGFVGKLRRRPESEQFFRLAKTAKQAMLILSSIQPDEARRKKGRSKPDRILR